MTASLARLKSTDPTTEANRLADVGRFEFRGVYGYTLFTPGIGRQSYIGPLRGVKIVGIKGTSDGIFSSEQAELNRLAEPYAASFNRQMLKRMRASRPPHPAAARLDKELADELRLLEKGDPTTDFRHDLRELKSKIGFIEAVGGDSKLRWETISGAERDPMFEEIYYKGDGTRESRLLASNSDVISPQQFARFVRAYRRYAVPYNRMVFAYLKQVRRK